MMGSDSDESPLTDEELVSTCALLIFGGHETTTNFLANGIRALLGHPDQLRKLREDPSLLDSAIEELLRFDGPSKMVMRRLESDVTMRGKTMLAGQNVYLVQGSANRDPDAFDRPNEVDITRKPNRHVAFGFGLHHCLGNFLARLEGSVGISMFIDRFPEAVVEEQVDDWLPTLISRGMHSFPVAVS